MNFWTEIYPASTAAYTKLASVGNDLSRLPESVRIFLVVNGAQGVMDNGSYAYFFEQDWPNHPPYDDFISAYEAIGCFQQAAELRRVVATFPFPDPHLHKEKRKAYMDEHYDPRTFLIQGWGNALCGDNQVWEKLASHVRQHQADFDVPPPRETPKPFQQFEFLCILIAILPGIIFFFRGSAVNSDQAAFRIAAMVICFILGVGGYAAIKIYQRMKG